MAKTTHTRNIALSVDSTSFTGILRRFRGQKQLNFSEISDLRQLLSNERARILYVIKNKKPDSIYGLAKTLKRDFKSVREDIKLLEKFGFLELTSKKKGKREMLRPVLSADEIKITITI